MIEGKGAFVRQSTGLRRLVWRGWALPVILGIAIYLFCEKTFIIDYTKRSLYAINILYKKM